MGVRDPALERVHFGGKLVIFAGDWRQVLPVVVRGGRAQVVNACLKSSVLWEQCLIPLCLPTLNPSFFHKYSFLATFLTFYFTLFFS
jgi:hypothetical protein